MVHVLFLMFCASFGMKYQPFIRRIWGNESGACFVSEVLCQFRNEISPFFRLTWGNDNGACFGSEVLCQFRNEISSILWVLADDLSRLVSRSGFWVQHEQKKAQSISEADFTPCTNDYNVTLLFVSLPSSNRHSVTVSRQSLTASNISPSALYSRLAAT